MDARMNKQGKMPLWVALVYSNIESRRVALYLVCGCAVFTAYCFPWTRYLHQGDWVTKFFLIDDWSWFAMMTPTTLWYWLGLRWIDTNYGWGAGDETC